MPSAQGVMGYSPLKQARQNFDSAGLVCTDSRSPSMLR